MTKAKWLCLRSSSVPGDSTWLNYQFSFARALCVLLCSEWLRDRGLPLPTLCVQHEYRASSLQMARPSSPFENCEGPATVLVILGIEFDSIKQAARLPADKLLALQGLISSWLPRRWCNRRKLESLFGHLHYAANVVWPGRAFLHCMIDLLCCFHKKDHLISLNRECHLDLLW